MKKLFKDRNLYFLLKQPYPENLYLEGFPIWTNKRLLPEFEKPLERTIKHLKKKIFVRKILNESKKPKAWKGFSQKYPLFTPGQGEIHVCSPRTLYRKISYFYKSLVEKKKFHILYGLWNQKKLLKQLPFLGMFSLRLLEKKIDTIFFKTGMFQSLAEVQTEIHHGRLRWNGEKILSKVIRGVPGDCFQLDQPFHETTQFLQKKKNLQDQVVQKEIPKRLFFTPSFFQYKRIFLILKKIRLYEYFLKYKKKI